MDELVSQLAEVTNRLVERIEQVTEEEILIFLDERDSVIDRMKLDQISENDRNRYRPRVMDILQHDQRILSRLNLLRNEAMEGISKLEAGKRQKTGYDTTYSHDSIYFDRKK
jgi:hypothetical protein